MLVYLRDGSAQAAVHAATLREKLQSKLSVSPSHNILTPGRPVPVLILCPGAGQGSRGEWKWTGRQNKMTKAESHTCPNLCRFWISSLSQERFFRQHCSTEVCMRHRKCYVSLVCIRREARWSVRFFSLFTVDNEGYVHQTNKQNWTLHSNEDKKPCVATLYIYKPKNVRKRKQLECSWTVRSRIFFYFQDLHRLCMSKGEQRYIENYR